MKMLRKMMFLIPISSLLFLVACQNTVQQSSLDRLSENRLYATESELAAAVTRSTDDDLVDWKLAKTIAQADLDSLISNSVFPTTAVLREYPILIYSPSGDIEYYEFRVAEADGVVGAITIVGKKSMGCPVAYEFDFPNDYSDSLETVLERTVLMRTL